MAFLNSIGWINPNLLKQNGSLVTGIFFLHDDASFNIEKNTLIMNSTITYLISAKGFDNPLFCDAQ